MHALGVPRSFRQGLYIVAAVCLIFGRHPYTFTREILASRDMHIVAAKIISHFSAIHKPSGCGTIPSRASHRSISRPIENLHTGLALRSFTRIRKSQKVVSARRTSRILMFFSGGFNLVVGVSVARHQVALTAARHARAHRLFARSVLRLPPVMRRRPRPVQSPPAKARSV